MNMTMKRTKIMITKVMAVLFCLNMAASCDKYDDSEIWDTIKELHERIEALEKQVEDNVAALQSMVTLESIRACEFDSETGKATLTLADGRTVTIDVAVEGNPFVTVLQDADGKYYWALFKEGKTDFLYVDGAKVPVSLTPSLKIADNEEWMISVDGGETWFPTGVFQQAGGESAAFFKSVKMEDGWLMITLADGTELKVAVTGDASISVSPDSLWFARASMVKSASIELNNVKSYTITEKPEGWKAFIEDSYLNVTSPEDMSVSSDEGTVKILALFEGGTQPEILSVYVAYEHPLSLSLDNESVVVKLSEHTGEDFSGYIIAAWKASEYTDGLALQWLNSEGAMTAPYSGNASYAVADIADDYSSKESYVVFAVPYLPSSQILQGNLSYEVGDIKKLEFKNEGMYWTFSDIRYDYAHLKASFSDVTEYYGGFFESEAWKNYGRDNILESLSFGGLQTCREKSYDGPASGFPLNEKSDDLLPSTEYVVWMIPYKESGKYVADDFVVRSFTTSGLSADPSVPAPEAVIDEITISGFTATVTPAAGSYKTYAAIRPAAAIPDDEMESVIDMMRLGNYSSGNEPLVISTGSYDSDTDLCLVAVSVSEDGRYGKIFKQQVELKELVFSDELSVSVTDIEYGLGDVTLSLSFTGNPVSLTYFTDTFTFFDDETLQRLLALGQLGYATRVNVSSLKDSKLDMKGLSVGSLYTFYAVVSEADGTSSKLYKYDFTPKVEIDYVLSSSVDYEYGMPSLSGTWSGSTYTMDVSKPAECVKYWVYKGDPEYFTGDPWTDSDKLLTGALSGVEAYTESAQGLVYTYMNKFSRIYMVWLDDQGSYHAIYEYNPQKDR